MFLLRTAVDHTAARMSLARTKRTFGRFGSEGIIGLSQRPLMEQIGWIADHHGADTHGDATAWMLPPAYHAATENSQGERNESDGEA